MILIGTVVSTDHGNLRELYALLHVLDWAAFVPPDADPRVCVLVQDDLPTCFYRVTGLSFATADLSKPGEEILGTTAIWTLEDATETHLLYGSSAKAVEFRSTGTTPRGALDAGFSSQLEHDVATRGLEALPTLRLMLSQGTPQDRCDVLRLVGKLGAVPLIPDAIDHLTDADRVTSPTDPIGFPVGTCAVEGLLRVASALDGIPAEKRAPERFSFSTHALDFDWKAAAVQSDWRGWWESWREQGPAVP